MATFPTPSQLFTQYKNILKSIKPSINVNDKNSDFIIRGQVFSAVLSGVYGDQEKVGKDTFVTTARPEALTLRGQDLGIAQQPATQSESPQIRISGTNGTIITPTQLSFIYLPTGVLYTNLTGGTISGGVLDLTVQSLTTGQITNVATPDTLQIVSPPSGVAQAASVIQSLADGTDPESTDSYRARLLSRFQQPPAGGNQTDYPAFAFKAANAVRTATIIRFGRGLGTVDIYITSGTTDIDTAVTNGLPIVRVPSSILINTVQAYYDANAPLTDCPKVYGPTENNQNVTINVDLAAGLTMSSVPADSVNNPLGLTVSQLITREVGRALYKVPIGGVRVPGHVNGFVLASAIEFSIGTWLSAQIDQVTSQPSGKIPVLIDWQVQPLDPPNVDKALNGNIIVKPNIVTIVPGV